MTENRFVTTYRELEVYQLTMTGAVRIFELIKLFPAEERYSLTDQIPDTPLLRYPDTMSIKYGMGFIKEKVEKRK